MAKRTSNAQASDSGLVVRTKDGSFWTGLGWGKQLRNAKIYRSRHYAQAVIDGNPGLDADILDVEIRVTGPERTETPTGSKPFEVIRYTVSKESPEILGSGSQVDWSHDCMTEDEAWACLKDRGGNTLERLVRQDGKTKRHWYDFLNECWKDSDGKPLMPA